MVEDRHPFPPSFQRQSGALGSGLRLTLPLFCPCSHTPSLGLTILEVACNMELPHGGEGWQQLRQGYLPPEFTAGEWRARMGGEMVPWGGRFIWEGMPGSGELLGSGTSHP